MRIRCRMFCHKIYNLRVDFVFFELLECKSSIWFIFGVQNAIHPAVSQRNNYDDEFAK